MKNEDAGRQNVNRGKKKEKIASRQNGFSWFTPLFGSDKINFKVRGGGGVT